MNYYLLSNHLFHIYLIPVLAVAAVGVAAEVEVDAVLRDGRVEVAHLVVDRAQVARRLRLRLAVILLPGGKQYSENLICTVETTHTGLKFLVLSVLS